MASVNDLGPIEDLISNGRYEQALAGLEPILQSQPGDAGGLFLQARALIAVGKQQQAEGILQDLLSEHPEQPEIYNNLAAIHASQGDFDLARKQLELALATHPAYQAVYNNLTLLYGRLASQAYHQALSPDEDSALPEIHLAVVDNLPQPVTPPNMPVAIEPAAAVPDVVADKKAIRAMIKGWARAWSSQQVERYLAYYDDHFMPADGLSRDEWAAQRQIRLENPQFIRLNVENIDVTVVDAHVASVFFSQHYESDRLNDTVSKNFIIRKGGGQWRIFQENLVR